MGTIRAQGPKGPKNAFCLGRKTNYKYENFAEWSQWLANVTRTRGAVKGFKAFPKTFKRAPSKPWPKKKKKNTQKKRDDVHKKKHSSTLMIFKRNIQGNNMIWTGEGGRRKDSI